MRIIILRESDCEALDTASACLAGMIQNVDDERVHTMADKAMYIIDGCTGVRRRGRYSDYYKHCLYRVMLPWFAKYSPALGAAFGEFIYGEEWKQMWNEIESQGINENI